MLVKKNNSGRNVSPPSSVSPSLSGPLHKRFVTPGVPRGSESKYVRRGLRKVTGSE